MGINLFFQNDILIDYSNIWAKIDYSNIWANYRNRDLIKNKENG